MGNTYNRVYIWCCKYGENRYCERCANKKWCASKHTGLLNSCLGKLCLHPYLVVPLISARVTLISTRVSAHCQAILLSSWIHPYASLVLWKSFRWFSANALEILQSCTKPSIWLSLSQWSNLRNWTSTIAIRLQQNAAQCKSSLWTILCMHPDNLRRRYKVTKLKHWRYNSLFIIHPSEGACVHGGSHCDLNIWKKLH